MEQKEYLACETLAKPITIAKPNPRNSLQKPDVIPQNCQGYGRQGLRNCDGVEGTRGTHGLHPFMKSCPRKETSTKIWMISQ